MQRLIRCLADTATLLRLLTGRHCRIESDAVSATTLSAEAKRLADENAAMYRQIMDDIDKEQNQ